MPGPSRRRVRSHGPYNVGRGAFPSRPARDDRERTHASRTGLSDEKDAIAFYIEPTKAADEADDIGQRTLFEQRMMDGGRHKASLELQIDLVERIGGEAYRAKLVTLDEGDDA